MAKLPVIETERLRLRPFTLMDVDDYNRVIHSDADVMRYLSGQGGTRENTIRITRYFIDHGSAWGFSFFAVTNKASGIFMGHAGLHKLSDTVELGYALGREYWGKGFATEASHALLRYGFETVGLDEIIALAYAENTNSRRVMERLGMVFAGETDRYYGTELVIYRLAKAAFVAGGGTYRVF